MKHKKGISLLIGSLLWLSMLLPAQAANFSDIHKVPWAGAATYINQVADSGLMVGDTDAAGAKFFRPTDNITYCEATQLVYKLLSQYYGTEATEATKAKYATNFSVCGIPSWAQPACAYCLENNVLQLSDLAYFMEATPGSISKNAQRENIALIFGRALSAITGTNGSAISDFHDAASISADAIPYINVLVQLGIISGDTNGNFNPKNSINRSEMAVIVSKTYNYLNTAKNMVRTPAVSSTAGSTVSGTYVSMNNLVINLNVNGVATAYRIGSNATFIVGGQVSNLNSMMTTAKSGDTVTLTLNNYNEVSRASVTFYNSSKYDVKGYYHGITASYISLSKSQTSSSSTNYYFDGNNSANVSFYIEGKISTYTNFKSKAKTGNTVTLVYNNSNKVTSVNLVSSEYTVEGYYAAISSNYISLKNSKSSSASTKYYFKNRSSNQVDFYVNGGSSTYSKFNDRIRSNDEIRLTLNSSDEIIEAYLTTNSSASSSSSSSSSSAKSASGYFYSVSSDDISISSSQSSSYYYVYDFANYSYSNVKFYVDGSSKSFSSFKSLAAQGDYIYLTLNSKGNVTEVWLTSNYTGDSSYETGYFYSVSNGYIGLSSTQYSSSYYVFDFANNSYSNVKFYVDGSSKSFSSFKSLAAVGDYVYMALNALGNVTEVWLTTSDTSSGGSGYTSSASGYYSSMSTSYIRMASTQYGSASTYYFAGNSSSKVDFYVDGTSKSANKFDEYAESGDDLYLVLNSSGEVTEVYLTSSSDRSSGSSYSSSYSYSYASSASGYYSSISSSYIRISSTQYGSASTYYFEDNKSSNVSFYVDGSSKSYSSFKSAASSGDDVYLELNSFGEVTEVWLTSSYTYYEEEEDSQSSGSSSSYDYSGSASGSFSSVSSSSIRLSSRSYSFAGNSSSNVDFYVDGSSVSYSSFKKQASSGDDVYLVLNSSGNVSEVYLTSSYIYSKYEEEEWDDYDDYDDWDYDY